MFSFLERGILWKNPLKKLSFIKASVLTLRFLTNANELPMSWDLKQLSFSRFCIGYIMIRSVCFLVSMNCFCAISFRCLYLFYLFTDILERISKDSSFSLIYFSSNTLTWKISFHMKGKYLGCHTCFSFL